MILIAINQVDLIAQEVTLIAINQEADLNLILIAEATQRVLEANHIANHTVNLIVNHIANQNHAADHIADLTLIHMTDTNLR